MMHAVYGWHEAVLQSFKNKVGFIERKWISLKRTVRPINLDGNTNKAPIA